MKSNTHNFAVVITTTGEENLLRALSHISNIDIPIYVVTPENYGLSSNIKIIKDKGVGKPQALNLAINTIKEDILILTDGDVYTNKHSIESIIKNFDDTVGLITGKVISLNSKDNMLGFWSHFLTNAANKMREEKNSKGEFFEGSGYLLAVRKNLLGKIPSHTLSDDGVISKMVFDKGYKIKYLPSAKVYVNYPTNFKDWIIQKKRSAGGYTRDKVEKKYGNRSFLKEAIRGVRLFFSYPKSLKEYYYLKVLFLARIYLWIIIFIDLKIKRKKFSDIWLRVESTK